jgi:hypothetical protein
MLLIVVLNASLAQWSGRQSIRAIVHDAVAIGPDGLDRRVEWCKVCFFNVLESPYQSLQRGYLVFFVDDVERLPFQQSVYPWKVNGALNRGERFSRGIFNQNNVSR